MSGPERVLIFLHHWQPQAADLAAFPRAWCSDPALLFLAAPSGPPEAQAALRAWAAAQGLRQFTFLQTTPPLAYGDALKLAWRYALDQGCALAVYVHGPLVPAAVDAVLAEYRQHHTDLIQFPATDPACRQLNAWQDRLLGAPLADYPVRCRGYSQRLLRTVPFELNAPDCLCNTQLALQAHYLGATCARLPALPTPAALPAPAAPVPTRGALWQCLLEYRLHRLGMLCSLRYRNLMPIAYRDKTQMLYSSHSLALRWLRELAPTTVLDLGCGPGYIAHCARQQGHHVTGVDAQPPLPGMLDRFHAADLDRDPLPVDAFDFDAILLLDVIEHLQRPEQFLLDLRNRARGHARGGRPPLLLLSTPNIAFAAIRLNLLLGRFSYAERGILDITHRRLFTRSTLRRLLADCGYEILRCVPVPVPFEAVVGGRLGRLLGRAASALAWCCPTLFGFQFMVLCRPRPGMRQLLAGGLGETADAPQPA